MESKGEDGDREFTNVDKYAAECPVVAVTVFRDRAEVTRRFLFKSSRTGKFLANMQRVAPSANPESFRVKGRGKFVILDISHVPSEEPSRVKTLEERMEEIAKRYAGESEELERAKADMEEAEMDVRVLDVEVASLDEQLKRIKAEKALADTYAGQMTTVGGGTREKDGLKHVLPAVDTFVAFAKAHSEKAMALEEEEHAVSIKRRGVVEQRQAANKKMLTFQMLVQRLERQLEADKAKTATVVEDKDETRWRRGCVDVSVGLRVSADDEDVELFITYTVLGPSWSPSYDIRADSNNNLRLTYYGSVKQSTGESWNDCELSLSTSAPSVGGTPPDLPGLTVAENMVAHGMPEKESFGSHRSHRLSRKTHARSADAAMAMPAKVREATVKESALGGGVGTTFTIPSRTSVATDGKPRKVTVATLPLRMEVTHYAVPAASTHAYLKARVTNSSDFPLLPSSEVQVFFNDSFIAKSDLKLVSPGEHFDVYLGSDPSVRITFKGPIVKTATSGFMTSSSTLTRTTTTQIINTRKTPVKILLRQQLPASAHAEIKVSLKEPSTRALVDDRDFDAKVFTPGVIRKDPADSIIEWYLEVAPDRSLDVPFVFEIESPADGRPSLEFV